MDLAVTHEVASAIRRSCSQRPVPSLSLYTAMDLEVTHEVDADMRRKLSATDQYRVS